MEKEYASVITAQRRNITAGSPIFPIMRSLLHSIIICSHIPLAFNVMCIVGADIGVNFGTASFYTLLPYPIIIAVTYSDIRGYIDTEFYVEDAVLYGHGFVIDLWTVKKVRYGKNCVYLDKNKLTYISKPKKFLRSLDEAFYQDAGAYLP